MPPRKTYAPLVAGDTPPQTQTNMFQVDKGVNISGGNFVQQNQTPAQAVHLCHKADGELESEHLRSMGPLG